MSRHRRIDPSVTRGRRTRRTGVAATFALLGLAVTGAGVFAALNATAFNSTAQTVSSGTLKLVYADNGAGFSTNITNMAPGDVVNRYVSLSNTGTLSATGLNLSAADATGSKLTSDATNGLHVTVTSCSTVWVPLTGTCTLGTTSVLLNNVAVSSLIASPSTLVAGAVAAGYELQFKVALPDQNETTQNGTLPANTIQGLSASMTWTFGEAQRAATTTNS
jgi:spore coat-associated protein N